MTMKAALAPVGSKCVDCITLLTSSGASVFANHGIKGVAQYLGSVTTSGVSAILAAKMAFIPVTYADAMDGEDAVSELAALGIPLGTTVWLDVESVAVSTTADVLIEQINEWADTIAAAGYQPGMYVGANCQLTSEELYNLHVVRYWESMSDIRDRYGNLARPQCGYCFIQCYDTQPIPEEGLSILQVQVDFDMARKDWEGRQFSWVELDNG